MKALLSDFPLKLFLSSGCVAPPESVGFLSGFVALSELAQHSTRSQGAIWSYGHTSSSFFAHSQEPAKGDNSNGDLLNLHFRRSEFSHEKVRAARLQP